MTQHDGNRNDLYGHFRHIFERLGEIHADRLLLGPLLDHAEAEHVCCSVLYGLAGGEVVTDTLASDTEPGLRLKRWALLGMVMDMTDGAVDVHVCDDLGELARQAIEAWPDLVDRAARDERQRAWHSDVVGHA